MIETVPIRFLDERCVDLDHVLEQVQHSLAVFYLSERVAALRQVELVELAPLQKWHRAIGCLQSDHLEVRLQHLQLNLLLRQRCL